MPADDSATFIVRLFCFVDDRLTERFGVLPRHPQARLWPSELVTVGLLFALKGGSFRGFYRWLAREHAALFGGLPDRTRLLRALRAHHRRTSAFLADPSFFTVIDSYGIELIHPWRDGRSPAQVGRKGFCGHRWIVGIKLCGLTDDHGRVVAWGWAPANAHDQAFAPLAAAFEGETITRADSAFHAAAGDPPNLKLCRRGTWNERLLLETALSLVHRVCRRKYLWHRAAAYLEMHLAYVAALFNALLAFRDADTPPDPTAAPRQLRWPAIAQYAL